MSKKYTTLYTSDQDQIYPDDMKLGSTRIGFIPPERIKAESDTVGYECDVCGKKLNYKKGYFVTQKLEKLFIRSNFLRCIKFLCSYKCAEFAIVQYG